MERLCDYCKKQGHTRETCFKIKGFPDWFTKKNGGVSKMAANMSMDVDYEDNPLEFVVGPSHINSGPSGGSSAVDSMMMQTIMQEVMRAMKGKHVGESSNNLGTSYVNCADINLATAFVSSTWIVDSGATDHMTLDNTLFLSSTKLHTLVEISLPYGSISYVSEIGNVAISHDLLLKDVFFMCLALNVICYLLKNWLPILILK